MEEISMTNKINTEEEAKVALKKWITEHGWTAEIIIQKAYGLISDETGKYYDFDVLRPFGVFHVYNDGTVQESK